MEINEGRQLGALIAQDLVVEINARGELRAVQALRAGVPFQTWSTDAQRPKNCLLSPTGFRRKRNCDRLGKSDRDSVPYLNTLQRVRIRHVDVFCRTIGSP
jgi:hypothetical protein